MLIPLSLISLFGAIIYKIYALNVAGVMMSLVLALFSFIILLFYLKNKEKLSIIQALKRLLLFPFFFKIHRPNKKEFILGIIYIALITICFYLLLNAQTSESIISPWEVIPKTFFLFYALSLFLLIYLISQRANFALFFISIQYLLSFSVALVVYKIYYGFDPFVHEATIKLIIQKGFVEPKQWYYLGQYSLIVILHYLLHIPVEFLNKIIVPFLAALYLPTLIYLSFKDLFESRRNIQFLILFSLILPYSIFILTTPQNLAFLFLTFVILLSFKTKDNYDLIIVFILSLTTFFIHLLAGIPALIFLALFIIYKFYKNKILLSLAIIILTLALPLAFWILEGMPSLNFNGYLDDLRESISLVVPRHNAIFDLVYLYGFNITIVLAGLIIISFLIIWKYKAERHKFIIYILAAFSALISYFLTRLLPFNFLIEYERYNYAKRILILSVLFSYPLIALSIYWFIHKIEKQNKIIKYSWLIFGVVILLSSLYLSYPRHDDYFNSHGYSVSHWDIEAVRWIDKNAKNKYIVLANQQTSAAALKEFGFKYYYNCQCPEGEVFYYSIPTSGILYQYYLQMVYQKPSRETIEKAMDLVGAQEAYFVLNKYWWASPKLLEEAELEADEYKKFGQDNIVIFKFKK